MSPSRRFLRRFLHHLSDSLRWLRTLYLRAAGVQIGQNTMISLRAKIDCHRGRVIIGNDCHITYGCVILSHDGAAKQLRKNDDGEGIVVLGDNVFVGVNSVVLRNVTIGDNSVIGAGSVVTEDVPSSSVVAGNPARVVKIIDPAG